MGHMYTYIMSVVISAWKTNKAGQRAMDGAVVLNKMSGEASLKT